MVLSLREKTMMMTTRPVQVTGGLVVRRTRPLARHAEQQLTDSAASDSASSLRLVSLSLVLAPLGQVQRRLAGEGSIMCPQSYGWLMVKIIAVN